MVTKALLETLSQVDEILCAIRAQPVALRDELYVNNNAGGHIRRVLDHLQALLHGLEGGVIDYDIRHRDDPCEVDPDIAAARLQSIMQQIKQLQLPAIELTVISEYDCNSTRIGSFRSNASREILYLINHTIHHAAYVRPLLRLGNHVLSEHIGIAPSTATHLRQFAR